MELSPSSEVTSCGATEEFPNMLRNPKVYYRVHKSPLLVSILSQMIQSILTDSISHIHFNTDLPPTSRFS
jgi:hypothetical protein